MAYLNFGDIRTFTRIVDSRGTKASIVGVVVCVDTANHNYVIVDTNGDEWTIGIGRSEVSSANIDQATQNVFNMVISAYNEIYELNQRASEIEAEVVYQQSRVKRAKQKLHELNFKSNK